MEIGSRSAPAVAGVARRRPKGERRVELDRMKHPGVRPRCVAGEASQLRRAVEEARRRQAAARLADDHGCDEGAVTHGSLPRDSDEPENLMRDETTAGSTALSAAQCARLRENGSASGLLER